MYVCTLFTCMYARAELQHRNDGDHLLAEQARGSRAHTHIAIVQFKWSGVSSSFLIQKRACYTHSDIRAYTSDILHIHIRVRESSPRADDQACHHVLQEKREREEWLKKRDDQDDEDEEQEEVCVLYVCVCVCVCVGV